MRPTAQIIHIINNRIRIKIASIKGDDTYFQNAATQLASALSPCKVTANAVTGSILISGDGLKVADIAQAGRERNIFLLDPTVPDPARTMSSFIAPLESADQAIRTATGNRLDLPGAVFAALIVYGLLEIIRGNWKAPPWYTAFWFAFGLYASKIFRNPLEEQGGDARDD
jgi:hypothetical protein